MGIRVTLLIQIEPRAEKNFLIESRHHGNQHNDMFLIDGLLHLNRCDKHVSSRHCCDLTFPISLLELRQYLEQVCVCRLLWFRDIRQLPTGQISILRRVKKTWTKFALVREVNGTLHCFAPVDRWQSHKVLGDFMILIHHI